MKYNFEFSETDTHYWLKCNNNPAERIYSKSRHSKTEAEELASDVVNKAIQRHGMSRVFYNGNHSLVTMADNFFKP